MDHNYAIENHTAERYLLQDLDEQERDAYEEHFFSCSACAEEVRTASEFLESAKQVVQDEVKAQIYGQHVARHSNWGNWLNWRSMLHPVPAMACSLLALGIGFSGYQNAVVLPSLRQAASAQLVVAQPTLHNSKSAVREVPFSRTKSFTLPFDIPESNFNAFDVSVVTESNIKKLSFQYQVGNEAEKALEIIVPAGTLDAGRYFIVIEGSGGKGEVDRIPFDLKSQD